jgi:hypothetical protein
VVYLGIGPKMFSPNCLVLGTSLKRGVKTAPQSPISKDQVICLKKSPVISDSVHILQSVLMSRT